MKYNPPPQMYFKIIFSTALLILSLAIGCEFPFSELDSESIDDIEKVYGWRPVYETDTSRLKIKGMPPRIIVNSGKIFSIDTFVYVVEREEGIHIIGNSNPKSPNPISFIQVIGCSEVSAKGDIIYTNSNSDLVTIDISDPHNPRELSRKVGAFPGTFSSLTPPKASNSGYYLSYFECVDEKKGIVKAWVRDTLHYPKCRIKNGF